MHLNLKHAASVATLLGASFFPSRGRAEDISLPPENWPRQEMRLDRPRNIVAETIPDVYVDRYKRICDLVHKAESLPASSSERSRAVSSARGQWGTLRQDAKNGDRGALLAMHGVWLELMHGELVAPGRNLVRFDYSGFDEVLRTNSGDDLKAEITWRALLGIRNYYLRDMSRTNPLVQDRHRFFEPTMEALEKYPDHPKVQKWGSRLLMQIYSTLSSEEQGRVADRLINNYWNDTDGGAQKLFALNYFASLRRLNPDLPAWPKLSEDLKTHLQSTTNVEELKFHICALSLLEDGELPELMKPYLQTEQNAEAQRAAAWALGHSRSEKGFELLKEAVANEALSPAAREMAVYSVWEYRGKLPEEVKSLLEQWRTHEEAGWKDVHRAASLMLERDNNLGLTKPDYYIQKHLPADQHDRYRTLRKQYIPGFETARLNVVQRNIVDRALIPYLDSMREIVGGGGQHVLITSGTITQVPEQQHLIGLRNIDGRMWDTIQGVHSNGTAVTPAYDLVDGFNSTFAHEFMHHIHAQALDRTQSSRVSSLFRHASQAGAVLNDYAALNEHEYLAEVNSAFDAQYVNHDELLFRMFNEGYDSGRGHTRSQLKERDADAHRFIDEVRELDDTISTMLHYARLWKNVPA